MTATYQAEDLIQALLSPIDYYGKGSARVKINIGNVKSATETSRQTTSGPKVTSKTVHLSHKFMHTNKGRKGHSLELSAQYVPFEYQEAQIVYSYCPISKLYCVALGGPTWPAASLKD